MFVCLFFRMVNGKYVCMAPVISQRYKCTFFSKCMKLCVLLQACCMSKCWYKLCGNEYISNLNLKSFVGSFLCLRHIYFYLYPHCVRISSNMLELTCHRLLCIFTLCASLSMFATIVGLKIPKCNIAEKIAGTHLMQTFYFYLPEHFLLQ